jgi:hypothetical protein
MTTREINEEIAKNLDTIKDEQRKKTSYTASLLDWQRKYDTDKKKSPEDAVTIATRKVQIKEAEDNIARLEARNKTLTLELDQARETEKTLASQGKTTASVEKEAEGRAKAVEKKAETEAKIIKDKADLELAKQQKLDNEMAVKMAKENAPKGMNPILKISLIALGVAGVMIGGFLLVKKMKK